MAAKEEVAGRPGSLQTDARERRYRPRGAARPLPGHRPGRLRRRDGRGREVREDRRPGEPPRRHLRGHAARLCRGLPPEVGRRGPGPPQKHGHEHPRLHPLGARPRRRLQGHLHRQGRRRREHERHPDVPAGRGPRGHRGLRGRDGGQGRLEPLSADHRRRGRGRELRILRLAGQEGAAAAAARLAQRRPLLRRHGERGFSSRINKLGIGPQGMGGRVTALAVHVESYPCHIASMPAAVNIQCHSHRVKEFEL